MIKEILQNNNKSLSKEKINQKKFNSILNGLDIFKKLNLMKKSRYDNNIRKNKNLKLLLNKNDNVYIKKVTNLKTTSINRTKREKSQTIFDRNDIINFDKRINYTSREYINNNKNKLNEESKVGYSYDKDIYSFKRTNTKNNQIINNLDKEFEIRCLNKKLEKLKMKNKEMKDNLDKIKNKNNLLKYDAINEQNNRNNILYSLKNIYNIFFQNKINHREKKFDLKILLLDLMDLKYNYENDILIDTFYQNIEQLIQISNIFQDEFDFYSNIENLVKMKKIITKELNDLYRTEKENKKYSEFCKLLFQIFETKDLDFIYNYLIKIENNNENDIKKIIKMRNILFSIDKTNSSSKRLNTNISVDKSRKNKRKKLNINYDDLQKIYIENNNLKNKRMTKTNNGCMTERLKSDHIHNRILNLKNQTIMKKINNNKIDIEKINKFLYSTKIDKISFAPHKNEDISNQYNNGKNKKLHNNLNTANYNITQTANLHNYTYSTNNENENVLNLNRYKKINYNESIKNDKIHPRIPSLKRINNYQPIYYK